MASQKVAEPRVSSGAEIKIYETRAGPGKYWAFLLHNSVAETPDQGARHMRGKADAKAGGVRFGRKPKLTPYQIAEAIKRRDSGMETHRSIARSYNVSASTISRLAAWTIPLFIPAFNRKEAEEEAPYWAERFVRVRGGFFVFDSEEALQKWKATPVADWPRV
jgi:hypothetical protein